EDGRRRCAEFLPEDPRADRHHLYQGLLAADGRGQRDRRPHRCVERLSFIDEVADGMVLVGGILLELCRGARSLVLGCEVKPEVGWQRLKLLSTRPPLTLALSPAVGERG